MRSLAKLLAITGLLLPSSVGAQEAWPFEIEEDPQEVPEAEPQEVPEAEPPAVPEAEPSEDPAAEPQEQELPEAEVHEGPDAQGVPEEGDLEEEDAEEGYLGEEEEIEEAPPAQQNWQWKSHAPRQAAPPADPEEEEYGQPLDDSTYDEVLTPHGHWEHHPQYGRVWVPHETEVGPGWTPYTRGHWEYTEQGWTWVSDFSWGWVPFHYGRWMPYGSRWVWIPGRDWAPAWVAWRSDDEVVGWAPLPYGVGIGASVSIGLGGWSFVPVAYLGAPILRTHYVYGPRLRYYYGRTRPVVGVYHRGSRSWYAGTHRSWVSRRWGRPVPVVHHRPGYYHRGAAHSVRGGSYRHAPARPAPGYGNHRHAPAHRAPAYGSSRRHAPDHRAPAYGSGRRHAPSHSAPSHGSSYRRSRSGHQPAAPGRGGPSRSAPRRGGHR